MVESWDFKWARLGKKSKRNQSSPQQALNSKWFVVVTSQRQFENVTYTIVLDTRQSSNWHMSGRQAITNLKYLRWNHHWINPWRLLSKEALAFLSLKCFLFCFLLIFTSQLMYLHTHILRIPWYLKTHLDITSEHTQLPGLVFSVNIFLLLIYNLKKGTMTVLSSESFPLGIQKDPWKGRIHLLLSTLKSSETAGGQSQREE